MIVYVSGRRHRTDAVSGRGGDVSRLVRCATIVVCHLFAWATHVESQAHDTQIRYEVAESRSEPLDEHQDEPQDEPQYEPWDEFTLPDREVGRAIRQGMPLTAEQIEKTLRLIAVYRETVERASRPAPDLRSREVALSLDAGQPAPVVAIQMGYTTGVVFIDATGEPWPVSALLVDEAFGPTEGDAGGHVVYVTPTKRFLHGNAIVELADLSTPVVLEFADGKGVVDSRLLVRIPRAGPNADPIVIERTDEFGPSDPTISAFLQGLAPAEASRVEIRGGNRRDRAWRLNDSIYLRTAKMLLAPQAQAFERGANGDTVYRLANTPYAVVSLEGTRMRLEFGGREEG